MTTFATRKSGWYLASSTGILKDTLMSLVAKHGNAFVPACIQFLLPCGMAHSTVITTKEIATTEFLKDTLTSYQLPWIKIMANWFKAYPHLQVICWILLRTLYCTAFMPTYFFIFHLTWICVNGAIVMLSPPPLRS